MGRVESQVLSEQFLGKELSTSLVCYGLLNLVWDTGLNASIPKLTGLGRPVVGTTD